MIDPVAILPHEPPFLFVDEVVRVDPEAREIEAIRSVPWDEPWTAAHLPGRPLVPGVILIEGMAQTCGILARQILNRARPQGATGLLGAVRSARFMRTVAPGSRLLYRGHLKARVGDLWLFSAATVVDATVVAEAEISLFIPQAR